MSIIVILQHTYIIIVSKQVIQRKISRAILEPHEVGLYNYAEWSSSIKLILAIFSLLGFDQVTNNIRPSTSIISLGLLDNTIGATYHICLDSKLNA